MNIEMAKEELKNAKIKVIGVGGGGCNAINRMVDAGVRCVEFIAVNTDAQVLAKSKAEHKIQIGSQLTKGLGAGSNPEVGEKSAQEDKEMIADILRGSDMVFVTAGMGGGTGTGAAPVIAEVCKNLDILTVAIVTKPFKFEGKKRSEQAEKGISQLQKYVDAVITIPNQNVLGIADKKASIADTFRLVDDVLRQGVQGISDIITIPGVINVDFADVKAIMNNAGNCIMGIGVGKGDNRAIDAATKAISNPLLDNASMEGANGILVNVTHGNDFSIHEYDEIVSLVTNSREKEANIIAGMVVDPQLEDEVIVTVIATGFNKNHIRDERIRRSDRINTTNTTNTSISNGINANNSSVKKLYPDEKPQGNIKNIEQQKPKTYQQDEIKIQEEALIKDFDLLENEIDKDYSPALLKKKAKPEIDPDNLRIPTLLRKRSD